MDHRISLGLSVYNALDIRNEIDVWPLTGKSEDPGAYYTDRVGLADSEHYLSSAYYDRPWRFSQPREVNFFFLSRLRVLINMTVMKQPILIVEVLLLVLVITLSRQIQ